jgi:hypothetical protein
MWLVMQRRTENRGMWQWEKQGKGSDGKAKIAEERNRQGKLIMQKRSTEEGRSKNRKEGNVVKY